MKSFIIVLALAACAFAMDEPEKKKVVPWGQLWTEQSWHMMNAMYPRQRVHKEEKDECPPAPVKPDIGDRCEWIPILDKQNCIRKYECMPIPPEGCPEPPQYPTNDANCRWEPIRDSRSCVLSWECTPTSSTHDDQHQHCCYWAQVGECLKNPAYMSVMCRASCTVSGCSDGEFFPFSGWAGTQTECSSNHRQNGCPYQIPFQAQAAFQAAPVIAHPFGTTTIRRVVGAPRPLLPQPLALPSVVRPFTLGLIPPLPRPTFSAPPSPPLAPRATISFVARTNLALPPAPPLLPFRPPPVLPTISFPLPPVLPSVSSFPLPPAPPPASILFPRLPTGPPAFNLINPCGSLRPCERLDRLGPEITIVPVPVKVPVDYFVKNTVGFQGTGPANPLHPMKAQIGPSTIVNTRQIAGAGGLTAGNFRGSLGHLRPAPIISIEHNVRPPFRLDALSGPPPIIDEPTVIAFPKGLDDGGIQEVVKTFGETSARRVKLGVKDYREPDAFADKMGLDGALFTLPQYLIDAMAELESEVEAHKTRSGDDVPAILGLSIPGEEGDEAVALPLPAELLSAIRRYKAALRKRREELEASRSTTPRPGTTPSLTRPPLTFWLGARQNSNPPPRAFIPVGEGGITGRPIGAYRRLRAQQRAERLAGLESLDPTSPTGGEESGPSEWDPVPSSEGEESGNPWVTTPVPRTTTDWRSAWVTKRQLKRWEGKDARLEDLAH